MLSMAKMKSVFFPSNMSPLPWKMLCVLMLICIFHDMDITMVFSFSPKMIKRFGVSEVNTGYYAGWLASSMYVGFLFCSLLWSYLGDRKGKKLSIMISTTGLALFILAFGFSQNYSWALVTRLLQGCCFGVVNVSKSLLNEQLDDTNMAFGMAVITSTGVVGLILGPSVSGYLVYPTEQYPKVFSKKSIFETYPILLPHLVLSVGLFIGLVLAKIYLPDQRYRSRKDKINSEQRPTPIETMSNIDVSNVEIQIQENGKTSTRDIIYSENTSLNVHTNTLSKKIVQVTKIRDCIMSCVLYGVLGFSSIASSELFSLFASTPINYHGIGLTTSQIGTVLMIPSIGLILLQIPILAKMNERFGARKCFVYSAYFQALMLPLLPVIATISNKSILWPLLCIHTFLLRLLVSSSFLTVTILINNTSPSHLNATANGVGFTLTALGRLMAPIIFGAMYSWSLKNVIGVEGNEHPLGFPFNHFFSFFVLSTFSVIVGILATVVSPCADYKVKR